MSMRTSTRTRTRTRIRTKRRQRRRLRTRRRMRMRVGDAPMHCLRASPRAVIMELRLPTTPKLVLRKTDRLQRQWAVLGIEPRTSRTLSENHTTRPNSQLSTSPSCASSEIFFSRAPPKTGTPPTDDSRETAHCWIGPTGQS